MSLLDNQDYRQTLNVILQVSIELYRVLMASLLILFVPQNCDGHLCSFQENLDSDSTTYTVGVCFNFITLAEFMLMYMVEIKRESKLIRYLEVNPLQPRGEEQVQEILKDLPQKCKYKIYRLDYVYQKLVYLSLGLFTLNTIISGTIIYNYVLGNQTTTTFITNVLFMVTKITDAYSIANTSKNIFYSAYGKDKLQFNDMDPKMKRRISTIELKSITTSAEPAEPAVVEHDAEPAVEPEDEPAETAVEPEDEPEDELTEPAVDEHDAEPEDEPAVELTAEHEDEPAVELTAEHEDEPDVEFTVEPEDERTVEPAVEPEDERTVEPAVEPAEHDAELTESIAH